MKMSGFLSVLLVISATLMFTAKGQSNYDMLREVEKKYFDMVIKYANDNFKLQKNQPNKEHLNFERRLGEAVIKPQEVQINLFLKATSCPKATQGSEHKHRSDCTFIEKKRPFINCVVCHKDFTSTKAFIDCIRHQDVKTRKDIRNKECSSPSNRKPGEGSLLGSTAKMDDLQAGCFGCH
ncbi:hypothetical protein UPYG_G00301260 [Umbra pygmaea]|uniref:Uncharacterized protein n=1 Tax=Umbra pygmaea TaxID=75934 RepID=A0ABD0WQ16_UMBPY